MSNPTKAQREWFARLTKHLCEIESEPVQAVQGATVLFASAVARSSDIRKIAASPTGALVTPRAGRIVAATEECVVFELDELANASGIFIGTTPVLETGTVRVATRTLSRPGGPHVTIMLGTAILLQVPRDDEHFEALAYMANGARIAIPSLNVDVVAWLGESFHRFRACVLEHLVRPEERLS